jgi:beta-aspartyl-peptidase (threonine type)
VFTNEGRNELDAAIMDGRTLGAGAVAGVTVIRNPITAARAVMEKSEHVMMAGPGAEQFARKQGLEIVDPSYFYTEERWRGLLRARAEDSVKQLKGATDPLQNEQTRLALLHKELEDARAALAQASGSRADSLQRLVRRLSQNILKATFHDEKFGTVGAVALDRQGNLAAATSTGGMTNKKYGRIGDAPIIGAGTYANNQTVAISCTGWGEYFIRLGMAKTISDMMEFGKMNLQKAAGEMINHRLPALGGDGGLIAVDKNGNISLPFCTEGMYRGFVKEGEKRKVAIYKD